MNRYNSNKEQYISSDKYIFLQSDPSVASLKYGRPGIKIKTNGCGMVAVYNVMRSLGSPVELPDIIREAEALRMPWLFGFFGTKPRSLGRYFSKKEISFKRTDDCAEFKESLEKCSAAIICTWCSKRRDGIHFFTIINDNGKLKALNRWSNVDHATDFSPADIRPDRFITGYLFGIADIKLDCFSAKS